MHHLKGRSHGHHRVWGAALRNRSQRAALIHDRLFRKPCQKEVTNSPDNACKGHEVDEPSAGFHGVRWPTSLANQHVCLAVRCCLPLGRMGQVNGTSRSHPLSLLASWLTTTTATDFQRLFERRVL